MLDRLLATPDADTILLKLFRPLISVTTRKYQPTYTVTLDFNFLETRLSEVKEFLEKRGITDYTVNSTFLVEEGPPKIRIYNITARDFATVKTDDELEEIQQLEEDLENIAVAVSIYKHNIGGRPYRLDASDSSVFVFESRYKDLVLTILENKFNVVRAEINFQDVFFEETGELSWCKLPKSLTECSQYLAFKCSIPHFVIYDVDGTLHLGIPYEFSHPEKRVTAFYKLDLNEAYHSTWEANLARLLNYLGVPFEYEVKDFFLDNSTYRGMYVPDFFLSNNRVIEMKGFWNQSSLRKIKAFNEEHPEYNLLIIDGDMYEALQKIYGEKIPHWEWTTVRGTKEKSLPVVGITQPSRIAAVKSLQVGDKVLLERDTENPYDKYAVKVTDLDGRQIGYVAANWTLVYGSKMDLGMKYEAFVNVIEPKVIKLEVTRSNPEDIIIYDFLKE